MSEELTFYKKNVQFNVGVRLSLSDSQGVLLSNANPYVAIEKNKLRDFIQANKTALEKGLLVKSDEPSLIIENANIIDDAQAKEIVKNVFVLKKKLGEISSDTSLLKLYQAAKAAKRSNQVLEMIENRLAEISPILMVGVDQRDESSRDSAAL
jgi:hypothetical protein